MRSLVGAAAAALLVLVPAGSGTGSGTGYVTFQSTAGSYEVSLPESWHRREMVGDGWYQGALSREPVDKPEDVYAYGVSILRLKDYGIVLEFENDDPDEIVLEFANRVGKIVHEQNRVTALPADERADGMRTFRIVAGEGTEDCLALWLVVSLVERKWFHAQWEIPCAEQELHSAEIRKMVGSLVVSPEWAIGDSVEDE